MIRWRRLALAGAAVAFVALASACDQIFNIETMNVYVRGDSTWVPVPDSLPKADGEGLGD